MLWGIIRLLLGSLTCDLVYYGPFKIYPVIVW
jgi:hypothetical protein